MLIIFLFFQYPPPPQYKVILEISNKYVKKKSSNGKELPTHKTSWVRFAADANLNKILQILQEQWLFP